jgi:hypothetical protein
MTDIGKELDPIIDEFNTKREANIREAEKQTDANITKRERFTQLINDTIQPTMIDFTQYLIDRGQNARINLNKHFFDIEFVILPSELHPHNYKGSVKFSQEGDKIKVAEDLAGNQTNEICDENEVSKEFVKNKLMNLIKNFYQGYFNKQTNT